MTTNWLVNEIDYLIYTMSKSFQLINSISCLQIWIITCSNCSHTGWLISCIGLRWILKIRIWSSWAIPGYPFIIINIYYYQGNHQLCNQISYYCCYFQRKSDRYCCYLHADISSHSQMRATMGARHNSHNSNLI